MITIWHESPGSHYYWKEALLEAKEESMAKEAQRNEDSPTIHIRATSDSTLCGQEGLKMTYFGSVPNRITCELCLTLWKESVTGPPTYDIEYHQGMWKITRNAVVLKELPGTKDDKSGAVSWAWKHAESHPHN